MQVLNKQDKSKDVTLNDVAQYCGLSVSTVSKILSGHPNFKQETAARVHRAVRALAYAPNVMARNIATKTQNRVVGFFVPNVMNPFFSELIHNVERRFSEHDYMLTLCLYHDDAEKLSKYINYLIETRAAGAIIACCKEDACAPDFLRAQQYMQLVSIQSDIDGVDRVDITDEAGTYEMISHLIQKGHRNIGFMGYRYDMSILQARLRGYLRALREHGLPVREEYIGRGEHTYASGVQMAHKLLDLPKPPTAIHCFNEFMAQGACEVIRARGLSIPEDISLTTFDNIFFSKLTTPPLTTIENPLSILADAAVNLLLRRIEHPDARFAAQQISIKHRFVERDSVKDLTT